MPALSLPLSPRSGCRLLPHVEKIVRAAADPELREVATNALALLERVSREGQEAAAQPANNKVDWQVRQGGTGVGVCTACGCVRGCACVLGVGG